MNNLKFWAQQSSILFYLKLYFAPTPNYLWPCRIAASTSFDMLSQRQCLRQEPVTQLPERSTALVIEQAVPRREWVWIRHGECWCVHRPLALVFHLQDRVEQDFGIFQQLLPMEQALASTESGSKVCNLKNTTKQIWNRRKLQYKDCQKGVSPTSFISFHVPFEDHCSPQDFWLEVVIRQGWFQVLCNYLVDFTYVQCPKDPQGMMMPHVGSWNSGFTILAWCLQCA